MRCLATDGVGVGLAPCVQEPSVCNHTRCTNSVRVGQLWYASRQGQLISTFTDTPVPPLALPV